MTVEKNYDITIRVICSIVIPGKSPEIKSLTDYYTKALNKHLSYGVTIDVLRTNNNNH